MVYSGGGINRDDNSVRGGGVWYRKRTDPVLDSLSDSYSELDTISVGVSGPSSYPTLHHLLTTFCLLP